jgi:hypothetical protein
LYNSGESSTKTFAIPTTLVNHQPEHLRIPTTLSRLSDQSSALRILVHTKLVLVHTNGEPETFLPVVLEHEMKVPEGGKDRNETDEQVNCPIHLRY